MNKWSIFGVLFILILTSQGTSSLNVHGDEGLQSEDNRSSETTFHFDFGSRSSPLMQLYTGITSTTQYSTERGYGLLGPAEEFSVTPRMLTEVNPNVLQRKWVYEEYSNDLTVDGIRSEDLVSFRVDLPNGTYRMVLWLGDLEKGIYSMNISINDEWLIEGADAFHTVHRSAYFEYQPNPRDPEKKYLNYGMPHPYYLEFNVTEGFVVVNVSGNDSEYWDLLAQEKRKEPASSYLSWMSTGTIKKSKGQEPWKYIGGPFTNASVLGLDIHPIPDLPLNGELGELEADHDIDSVQVMNGVSAANAGNLEGAFHHWKLAMEEDLGGRNMLARSQLGMILAGSLGLDREIDILPLVEEDLIRNTDQRGDPAHRELFTWVDIANRGLHFEFNRTTYAGDGVKKGHFLEANKAFVLLDQIPEISPLFPKIRLWAARCLMNLDPHRWTSASGTALEIMEGLRHLDPDNVYIRMYLDTTRDDPPTWEIPTPVISTTGVYDNWTLRDYNSGFEGAPVWASLIHEELGWLYDVTDWWVEERMQENGYLGGGWTDDVEMIGLFGFDALISEGADDLSLEGAGRFVDGMLSSGQVNMELGFSEAFADVEHTAELTGDSLPMMIAVDFGNPKWIEFSMKTAVLMRDLWMGENERGWFQFRSNYLSATRVGAGGQAEDSWINFRAVLPALWAWWYSNDPAVEELIVDWADSWVNAALSTDKDKPMGIIPAGIGWPDGEIGGHNSPNWYTAAHPSGSVNYDWAPQKYKSYITTLLETAFDATRNLTFLEPLRLEAVIAKEYIDEPVMDPVIGSRSWAGKVLGQKAIDTYHGLLDKYQLPGSSPSSTLWRPQTVVESCENGYNYIRKCYPLMTTEASATDRVLFVGVINPFQIFTGGSVGGALLAPQFTYSGLERDFAAMVRDANAVSANISIYGFFEGDREAALMPWALEIGGSYSLELGPDEDGNGIMDSVKTRSTFNYLTRGQKILFNLTGDAEYLLSVKRIIEGSGLRPRMPDPAFDLEDEVIIDKENGTVTIKVHNIGSEDIEELDIYLYEDLDGGLRQIGGAEGISLSFPVELEPSIEMFDLHIWNEPWIGEVVIIIDPENEILEISDSNNEIRGYWDLEGIKITERDLPLEVIGETNITLIEDDELSGSEVLDLSTIVIDPDGMDVHFSINGLPELPWIPVIEGSILSLEPVLEDYFGNFSFLVSATDPGPDGEIDTQDDGIPIELTVNVLVLPSNDAPELIGIELNGSLIEYIPGETMNITVLEGKIWTGELVTMDKDMDEISIHLLTNDSSVHLENDHLIVNGSEWRSDLKTVDIVIDDGNSSSLEVTLNFILERQPAVDPVWVGMALPNRTILRSVGNIIEILIDQGGELELHPVVTYDVTISFQKISGHEDIILDDDRITIKTTQEHVDSSPVEATVRAIGYGDLFSDILIRIEVIDVNDIPSEPNINMDDVIHLAGEVVIFSSDGSLDIDGDDLEYIWEFGDESSSDWGIALLIEHTYKLPGDYTVTLHVRDGRGGLNSSSTVINVEEDSGSIVSDDDDDDNVTDKDDLKISGELLFLIILVILVVLVLLIAVLVVRSRKDEEDDLEDEMDDREIMGSDLDHLILSQIDDEIHSSGLYEE